jgi:excisionase family DNA binding protein
MPTTRTPAHRTPVLLLADRSAHDIDRPIPMSTSLRPIESYVHGLSSPLGLLEGREAMALLAFHGLDAYQRQHRGSDAYLDRAVAVLRLVSAAYRAGPGCAATTSPAKPPQPQAACGERLTTGQVASLRGVSRSAVTRALREGRLRGERAGRRWLIDPEDAAQYRCAS